MTAPPSESSGSVGRVRKTRVARERIGASGGCGGDLSSWWQRGQESRMRFVRW